MKKSSGKNANSIVILVLNILLLAGAIASYGRYVAVYPASLTEENLRNISNLNQSAAINATSLISSWDIKLNDIVRYVRRNELTHAQLLNLLDDGNSSEERQFELIGDDYTGYLARRDESGAFIPVSYRGESYSGMQRIIDDHDDAGRGDIRFVPEFTDSYTALKHFGVFAHIPLLNDYGQTETYTLLLASNSRMVLAAFNGQNLFEGMSTVLVDEKGNYIVRSDDFKSDNFFQYLYVYNDLSLDARNEIRRDVLAAGGGELYFRNGAGQDCVFRYMKMDTSDWYCITSVPLSSFRTPVLNMKYMIYAVLMLLMLLLMDMLWQRGLNKRLKVSMLREKEANAAKTDFLSRMSHDIRTPLNGIIGMTLLAAEEKNPPNTVEYLENIKVSGNFLLGLVNDILDMSKVESGKLELHPERYEFDEFCKYMDAIIVPLCKVKKQEFRMKPSAGADIPVMFDRLRLNQIFFNLLSNAVKYTPEGGLVELFWTGEILSSGRAAFDFTVRDNGIGMSEQFQERMFEPFSQERSGAAAIGCGLGLAIVRRLIDLMGGRISVASKEGEGTSFFVHLEADVCRRDEVKADAVNGDELQGMRALLCEDNSVNVIIARKLLEKWGVTVDTAENGKVGLDKFAASSPGYYDVVLMDIRMPEMNGYEATRAIRALTRPDAASVPIIAMTANAYDEDVKNCLDAGMNAHTGKPIQAALLYRTIVKELAIVRVPNGNGLISG